MTDEKKKSEKNVPSDSLKSIEAWAAELGTQDWNFAAAKAIRKWGMGKEVSKAEFETAVFQAANLKCNP